MADPFQYVGRNHFNLISSLNQSHTSTCGCLVNHSNPFPHHKSKKRNKIKNPHLYKICCPEKDLTVFMLESAPARRCTPLEQRAGRGARRVVVYTPNTPTLLRSPPSCHGRFISRSSLHLGGCSFLSPLLVSPGGAAALCQSQRHPEGLSARLNPDNLGWGCSTYEDVFSFPLVHKSTLQSCCKLG